MNKKDYDPHLLYHSINLTSELKYAIPLKTVYTIVEQAYKTIGNIPENDLLDILKTLSTLQITKAENNSNDENTTEDDMKDRIKEILKTLGDNIDVEILNMILKGEKKLEDVMNKKQIIAWKIMFNSKDNHFYPNMDAIRALWLSSCMIAVHNLRQKAEYVKLEQVAKNSIERQMRIEKNKDLHMRKIRTPLDQLEKQLKKMEEAERKLRLYIGHMQGYDKDLDRDGGRGIDMTTGFIVDYDDIYIADKIHGSILIDKDNDGIDLEDIK